MIKWVALFITTLAISISTISAQPQQSEKPARIGTLMSGTPATHGKFVAWFRQGMRQLGYHEGRDYELVSRWGMGNRKRLPAMAQELVREKVDAIVLMGSPVIKVAMAATQKIPVVVGASGVLEQFITSFAKPGGNVTGSTYPSRAMFSKKLGVLKEALPGVRRVAVLYYFSGKRGERDLKSIASAGDKLSLEIKPMRARNLGEVENAFLSMAQERVDALMINNSSFSIFHHKHLVELANTRKIPSICGQIVFAQAGCLLTYMPDQEHMLRRAASFVDRILKGGEAAKLPVEISTRYKFVINFKTAKSIGISLPSSILLQATDIVE